MKKSIGSNCIVFPTPVFIIGTYDKEGAPNIMNAAWGGICSSTPPCIMVAIRDERCTYKNIMDKNEFTVSIPSAEYADEADYVGLISGFKENKFEKSGLTPVKSEVVDAPYVGEFPFVMECRLLDSAKVGSHVQLMAEILDIKVNEDCLDEKGSPEVEKIKPLVFDPAANTYNEIGPVVAKAFSAGIRFLPKNQDK